MTTTGKLVYEETAEDWDDRFTSGSWSVAGGTYQSAQFMYTLLQMLEFPKAWSTVEKNPDTGLIDGFRARIHDYGCALGDGTALLQIRFPLAKVVGIDHSPKGIEEAKKRWPTVDFKVGDICNPTEMADVIFTSHTLEHLKEPDRAVRKLMQYCGVLIAIFPPITKENNGNHDGAEPVEDWLRRLPPPVIKDRFLTIRKDVDSEFDDQFYIEQSIVCVWKTLI